MKKRMLRNYAACVVLGISIFAVSLYAVDDSAIIQDPIQERLNREQESLRKEQEKQDKQEQKAQDRKKEEADRQAQLRQREKEKQDKLEQKALERDKAQRLKEMQLKQHKEELLEKARLAKLEREKEEDEKEERLKRAEEAKQQKIEQQKIRAEQARLEREEKARLREQEKEIKLQQKEAGRTISSALKKEQPKNDTQATAEKTATGFLEQEQKQADDKIETLLRQSQEINEAKRKQKADQDEKARLEREKNLQKLEQDKQARIEQKEAERKKAFALKQEEAKLRREKQQEKDRLKTIEREKYQSQKQERLKEQEQERQSKTQQKTAERENTLSLQKEQDLAAEQAQKEAIRLKTIEREKAETERLAFIKQQEQEKQAQLKQKAAEREKSIALKQEQARLAQETKQNKKQVTGRDYYDALINELNVHHKPNTQVSEDSMSPSVVEEPVDQSHSVITRKDRLKLSREKRQELLQQQAHDHMANIAQEVEGVDVNSQDVKRLLIGRDYYYALVDVSTQRRWAIPITCNFSLTNGAFDNNGQHTSLSNSVMGGPVTLADIYLFSRLGDENLVGNNSTLQPSTKSPSVNQNGNLPFGTYANDLYTTLLAPMQVGFGLQQSEACIDFTAMYRFDLAACGKVMGYVGATLPVKTAIVDADLQLQQGILYIESFAAGQNVVRERTLTQFFGDYESVEDFFIRAVLGGKGIGFANRQVKVGMGDFSLFGIIDIGGLWEYADGIQFGLTVIFPTGSAGNPNMLFNPSLSNGAYSFEPFFSAIFNSPSPVFNPAVKLVGSFSGSRSTGSSGGTRVGQSLSSSGRVQVKTVPGLSFPARFADYYVSGFSGSTSSIPMFGDAAVPATVKLGNKFLLGIGNYFFNVFNLGFRLGVFYDYIRKSSDKVCIDKCQGLFDTAGLTANTTQRSHSIGFNLTYKFKNMLELNFGTENVIGGRNVPRTNDFFVSMIAVF